MRQFPRSRGPLMLLLGLAHVRGRWCSGLGGAGRKGCFGRTDVVQVAGRQRGWGAACEATDGGAGGHLWEQRLVQPAETAVCAGGQQRVGTWSWGKRAMSSAVLKGSVSQHLSCDLTLTGFPLETLARRDSGQGRGSGCDLPMVSGEPCRQGFSFQVAFLEQWGPEQSGGCGCGPESRRGVCLLRPHFGPVSG